jgi:hypothetical protein
MTPPAGSVIARVVDFSGQAGKIDHANGSGG